MDAGTGTDGAIQREDVPKDEVDIKARIQMYVSSSRCEDSIGVYCTPCEIMLDALDRIEYLESLVGKQIQKETNNDGCGNTTGDTGCAG